MKKKKDIEEIEKDIQKKPSRLRKWTLRILLFLLLFIVFIVGGAFVSLQFKSVRSIILDFAEDAINTNLNAKLNIDDFTLTSLKSVDLYGASLILEGDTIVYIPEASALVNIGAIIDGTILVNSLQLHSPMINMLKDSEGVWNVAKIAKPSDDTTAPADTKILISRLYMENGDFRMYDPYAEAKDSSGFNLNNLHLENLNFNGELFIRPTKKKLIADLDGLSFYESVMQKKLSPTNLTFMIDSNYIKLDGLEYNSGKTELNLSAEIVGLDVFGGVKDGDIEKAELKVNADAKKLDIQELFTLLNVPVQFKGNPDIELIADGTFSNINIEKFDMKLDNSNINLEGNIKNVLEGDKLYFNVKSDNSYLTYADLVDFLNMKNSKLPDFRYVKINSLAMKGQPKNLFFNLNVSSPAGNLDGDLQVENSSNLDIKYDGNVASLNVNELFPNTIKTDLNGEVHTTLKRITSDNPIVLLDFDGGANSINEYNMTRLKIDMDSENFKTVRLDTLYAEFGSSTMGYGFGGVEKSYIKGHGSLNIKDETMSEYNMQLEFNAIDLKRLLDMEQMPNYLTGRSHLKGQGLKLNDITGEFDTDIESIIFDDRAFFPFSFGLAIDKFDKNDRKIEFNSDFGKIILQGKYDFENLISSLQNQGYSMYNFIAKELNKLIPKDQEVVQKLELMEVQKIGAFEPLDATLNINVPDFSFVTAFVDSTNLKMNADLNFRLYADSNKSSLVINKMEIKDLYYASGDQQISTKSIAAEGGLYMELKDSSAVFSNFNLKTKVDESINIGETVLNYPALNLDYDGNEFKFTGQSDINNQLDVVFDGRTIIIPGGVQLEFTKLDMSYQNEYNLSLSEPIEADFVNGGFTIKSMELTNPNSDERLNISGEYNAETNDFEKFKITLNSMNMQAIKTFVPRQNKKQFEQLNGIIDTLDIVINGNIANPAIDMSLRTNDVKMNEQIVGDIEADLKYRNKNLQGDLIINHYSEDLDMPNLVKGEITSLPIDLSLTGVESRFSDSKQADMKFVIDSLPLSILSPFVPSISYLKGIGKGKLLVSGILPDKLKFNGIVRFDNTSFLVDATNVGYYARGGLILKEDKVILDDVKLYNQPDDLSGGKADVNGYLNLEDMDLTGFDLSMKTDRLLVMHDETQKVKNDLFGRLIIATESDSLRFYGSFDEPNLDGYVAIESADLKMPEEEDIQLVKSKFIYRRSGDVITASYGRADSVKVKKTAKAQEVSESLMDLLNIDLDIEFRGRTNVEMQINQFLRTSVIIGTPINVRSIRYVKKRYNKEAKLYGRIILKEGSKLSFFKTFDISGDINFPTGNISNPTLDLKAEYEGTTADYKKFTVEIFVTGTKESPNLRFEYEIAGDSGYGDKEKKLSDIISLLLTGRTSSETNASNGQGQDINLQSTIASDLLTRQVAQELGKLGLSAQIDFDDNFEDAKVKIGGDIVGGARWSFGGNVNDISGSRLEIEIPLDDFINLTEEEWLNILLNFTYVNSPETVKTDENQIHWEGKLKLGGSW